MYAPRRQIPHFSPKSRAGKAPRGNVRGLLAQQIPRMAARRLQAPIDQFPNWQHLIDQGFYNFQDKRGRGGSPGPRYH